MPSHLTDDTPAFKDPGVKLLSKIFVAMPTSDGLASDQHALGQAARWLKFSSVKMKAHCSV